MGIFKSLKGKVDVGTSNATDSQPAYTDSKEVYSPPAGPPPSHTQNAQSGFQPPPGPPPSANPPPYHDWTVIPDTALLPPPPAFPQEYSSTNNATYQSAEAGHAWCDRNPVFTPSVPNQTLRDAVARGNMGIQRPDTLAKNAELKQTSAGIWHVKTKKGQTDAMLLSTLPLYFAAVDSPLKTGKEYSVYFELKVLGIRDGESGIAIGYAAKPCPLWRLPGWHRASVGVHGDDGRRFVNDSWGGRDFVAKFEVGDVVGLGMKFETEERGGEKVKTRVSFTRNGREEGGWEADEERDAERDEGIEGLQGELDMYPAVGVFGGIEAEIRLRREDWLYQSS